MPELDGAVTLVAPEISFGGRLQIVDPELVLARWRAGEEL
jgi:hypothetical protein